MTIHHKTKNSKIGNSSADHICHLTCSIQTCDNDITKSKLYFRGYGFNSETDKSVDGMIKFNNPSEITSLIEQIKKEKKVQLPEAFNAYLTGDAIKKVIACLNAWQKIPNNSNLCISPKKRLHHAKYNSISFEKSQLSETELKEQLMLSFSENNVLIPKVRTFFRILLSEHRTFNRKEIKIKLHEKGIGNDIGRAGNVISSISGLLTRPYNGHLRQVVYFKNEGLYNETKNDYIILEKYRTLISEVLDQFDNEI